MNITEIKGQEQQSQTVFKLKTYKVLTEEIKISENSLANKNLVSRLEEKFNRENRLDPTRYGDWEKNGRCIDF